MKILPGLLLPLVGTTLGAGMVFFLREELKSGVQKALLGFAAGVMIAASVWSLLIPAIDMAGAAGTVAWVPAVVGFLGGVAFLLVLDTVIPHLHLNDSCPEGAPCSLGRSSMLVLAVTLHNIPEGMAVGVVLAGALSGEMMSAASALVLALGIAIQNFPEGAVISMPLVGTGLSRGRAFRAGFLSGVVEPISALVTIALTAFVTPVLPYILSFAAGAMLYVVIEELIPESQAAPHTNIGTLATALGFALMMVLDVALG
ncbi:MAG: ZIP family metal transporter [Eubacteriales bacterium]|nr:ZIP family metal transporter [Eubacteriales bacterium]